MLSWSSQEDEPVGSAPAEEERPKKRALPPDCEVLKPPSANEKAQGKRFVCATCEYEIGSNSNLFFMLDSVYCSQQCRTASVSKSDDTDERLRACWNIAPRKTPAVEHPARQAVDIFETGKKRERSEKGGSMFAILAVVR
tara:strand:+ start:4386 stop:4805 length:420 start_codon:yes stop_codon:yes gene_type:complete